MRRLETISPIVDMPTEHGHFQAFSFKMFQDDKEHLVLMKNIHQDSAIFVRIHSECLTGDVFGSLKCDCAKQLKDSLKKIEEEGSGIVVYLRQEGRGIGLINKMKAYALQAEGYDTVEANLKAGCVVDNRTYEAACAILEHLKVKKIKLLTNNPEKVKALESHWRENLSRIELSVAVTPYNKHYLETKTNKLKHLKGIDR